MGTEPTSNGLKDKEILQTEYSNTTYDKEFNININDKYNLKAINNKNSNNHKKKLFFGKKSKIINNPKSLTNVFLDNSRNNRNIYKKKIEKNNILNHIKIKDNEKQVILKNDLVPKTNCSNRILFDYFKCISCPMCIFIQINIKNNNVSIKCENGHNNEMNIDSFNSIYQIFKYSCDKCKKELSSNYYYCSKCKELFCDSCMNKNLNNEINKGHIFLNETEINFLCNKHKKRYINFCKNCQKNCCKKCCAEHSSHELLLIKNEIRDNNYITQIEKMINKEKEILDKIEEKYPVCIFKNKNPNLLKSFNRLISLRKKEYQLKNKILKLYQDCIQKINSKLNENNNENTNLDISMSSISSTNSIGEYTNNYIMNYYFLKCVNELENEVLSNINDFFDISEDNKFYKDFTELKNFLKNYKNDIISPEKNFDNFSKFKTIYKKPNYIFPLDDGNFIVTYNTKIIFYDGLSGDELLIMDEEIFDYTYKIIKLSDDTLLFFGDFLNHIKIDQNGSIKVLFTGSHIEILKEVILDQNNLVYIDKITQKLKILTNKDINWHKEIFPDYPPNKEFKKIKNNEDNDLNKSMTIDLMNNNITKGNNDEENKLNNSFITMNETKDAKELFLNSIKNMRLNKKNNINDIIKNTNNINYKIKTFDIISLDESNFISLQEKSFQNKNTCLRIFNYNQNNFEINLIDVIDLEDEPLKKNDVLFLIKDEKEKEENNIFLGYGSNDKKYFIVYDLNKKMNISKINLNFICYRFFGNILLFQNQNDLVQYYYKDNEFIYISKLRVNNIIYSINFLKNFSIVLDDRKYIYLYSYEKNKENI